MNVTPVNCYSQDPNVVQTTDGPIRGTIYEGLRVWSGIPFAAPPTGNNRWKPPQPVTPWTTIRGLITDGNIPSNRYR